MNIANNKRRQATREKIEKAFIEILQNKEINEITVSEIIKATGFNRSTFYANYLDIYDLADKIRENLEKAVEGLFEREKAHTYDNNNWIRLFNHIKENQLFYKTYFKLGYDNSQKIDFYNLQKTNTFFDNKYIEYHVEFFKSGFNAMVKKWLNAGCKESPEEMANILKNEYNTRNIK